MATLSIIIPTLNEASNLGATLEALGPSHEVIVVDGGSDDETETIARRSGAHWLIAREPGRASQMNEGASVATGAILVFLHADTLVKDGSLQQLSKIFDRTPKLAGGGFCRTFDSDSSFLQVTCWLANFRSRFLGWFLGDQGMFVRRTIFEEIGGYREDLDFGEDLDLSIRLKQVGKVIAITPGVISSARRFDSQGPVRQTFTDLRLAFQIIRLRKRKN